jgi:hypothetical protein
MKRLIVFSIFVFSLLSVYVSCTKDEGPVVARVTDFILKKWTVNSVSPAPVIWIEFIAGDTFLMKKNDGTYFAGKFSISADNKTVTLNRFGLLDVTRITANAFDFTLRLNAGGSYVITTSPNSYIAASPRAIQICQNWNLRKTILYTSSLNRYDTLAYPVTTTTAGTKLTNLVITPNSSYFLTNFNRNASGITDTSYAGRNWQWKDAQEKYICIGDPSAFCNGNNDLQTIDLTDTKLTLQQVSLNRLDTLTSFFVR